MAKTKLLLGLAAIIAIGIAVYFILSPGDPNRRCAVDIQTTLTEVSNWKQLRPKLDQINTNGVTDQELLEALPLMVGLARVYDRAGIDLHKVRANEDFSTWEKVKTGAMTITTDEGLEAAIDADRCSLLRKMLRDRYGTDFWIFYEK